MAFLGQIPEEVDRLAGELDVKAGDIDNIIATITGLIGNTTWTGPDRDRYEGDWNGKLRVNMQMVADSLREAATTARMNSEQQRQASA